MTTTSVSGAVESKTFSRVCSPSSGRAGLGGWSGVEPLFGGRNGGGGVANAARACRGNEGGLRVRNLVERGFKVRGNGATGARNAGEFMTESGEWDGKTKTTTLEGHAGGCAREAVPKFGRT